jgi:hypothetical protein
MPKRNEQGVARNEALRVPATVMTIVIASESPAFFYDLGDRVFWKQILERVGHWSSSSVFRAGGRHHAAMCRSSITIARSTTNNHRLRERRPPGDSTSESPACSLMRLVATDRRLVRPMSSESPTSRGPPHERFQTELGESSSIRRYSGESWSPLSIRLCENVAKSVPITKFCRASPCPLAGRTVRKLGKRRPKSFRTGVPAHDSMRRGTATAASPIVRRVFDPPRANDVRCG